jgi:hypothetical protein
MPKGKYQTSWQEKPSAAAAKQSALKLAQTIAELGVDVLPAHKKKLLDIVVWIVTEASGKYNTRYVSGAVYDGGDPIRHEHVFPRKYLVEQMLEKPGTILQVLDNAIGCLVTKDEHHLLTNMSAGAGWDRYYQAGIRVYDRLEGKWLDFKQQI